MFHTFCENVELKLYPKEVININKLSLTSNLKLVDFNKIKDFFEKD